MKKKQSSQEIAEMFRVTHEKVNQAIQRLINLYNPMYIYTFGSYAKNSHDEESDFDVMVVVDAYDGKSWEVAARGYLELSSLLMPVDLLVYDQKNFDKCKDDTTSFCHKILKSGKLLYERKK